MMMNKMFIQNDELLEIIIIKLKPWKKSGIVMKCHANNVFADQLKLYCKLNGLPPISEGPSPSSSSSDSWPLPVGEC